MATWQQRYAHLLNGLDDAQRGRVLDSIQSGYLEGFEPDEADVKVLVRYTLGEITSLEAFADGAARHGQKAREAREGRAH
jgi:hypothetical protein